MKKCRVYFIVRLLAVVQLAGAVSSGKSYDNTFLQHCLRTQVLAKNLDVLDLAYLIGSKQELITKTLHLLCILSRRVTNMFILRPIMPSILPLAGSATD